MASLDRILTVKTVDGNGEPLPGALVSFFIDDQLAGSGVTKVSSQAILQIRKLTTNARAEVSYGEFASRRYDFDKGRDELEVAFDVHSPYSRKPPFLERNWLALLGFVLLLVSLALAFSFGQPNPMQSRILPAVTALGGGAFGSGIPGMLGLNWTIGKTLTVSAAGAAAIFVLLLLGKY